MQRVLAENVKGLAVHGILYPTLTARQNVAPPLPWVGYQHGPALAQLEGKAQKVAPMSDLGQITRQIDTMDHDVLVLSAEYLFVNLFYSGADQTISFLKDRGYQIETISYLRDQPERINSLYAQRCKTGQWQTGFDAYCTHRRRKFRQLDVKGEPMVARGLHHDRLASPEQNAWGRHTFRPFSSAVKARGIEADFMQTMRDVLAHNALAPTLTELACQSFHPAARSNDRDGTILVALCRQLSKMVVRRTAANPKNSREQQRGERAVYPAAVAALEAVGVADPKYQALTPARDAELRQMFFETNEVFAKTVWGCAWADVFPVVAAERLISNDLDECHDADLTEGYRKALPIARKELRKALDGIAKTLRPQKDEA